MQLGDQEASGNVEDRRGMGVGGGLGVGGVAVALIAYFLGFDPFTAVQVGQQVAPRTDSRPAPKGAPKDEAGLFVSKVLGSTERVWGQLFRGSNVQYRPPTLVLFTGQVRSACGVASAQMGPFYCPSDEKLYMDLDFFRVLQRKLGAPGDFAQAYVIAHEVGHHVQKLTGSLQKGASVRTELQADCYAGVWGHHAAKMKQLDPGDAEEGLGAAAAVGDDRLQQQARGKVVPESFTHGSSEQRKQALKRGLDSGRPRDCDTFSAPPA